MENKEIKSFEISDEETAQAVGGFAEGDVVYLLETNDRGKIVYCGHEPAGKCPGVPGVLYMVELDDGRSMMLSERDLVDHDQTCALFTPLRLAGKRNCRNCCADCPDGYN